MSDINRTRKKVYTTLAALSVEGESVLDSAQSDTTIVDTAQLTRLSQCLLMADPDSSLINDLVQ